MELLERDGYLETLKEHYHQVRNGNGHTLFLVGEAGIGKTSLINHFIKQIAGTATIYSGSCDSLFTPRPLGPLFDIAGQIDQDFTDLLRNEKNRVYIFSTLIQKISVQEKLVVLIFEDIHWADEATVDLIKFLARRIHHQKCLFLLSYRDDEIHSRHPLKAVFGELPSGAFSKLSISPLSRETVNSLALAKGYAGDEVYTLTRGNPFYVTEILANYSLGIPERVKDSILTVFYSKDEKIQALWEFLSILPLGIKFSLAERIEHYFPNSVENSLRCGAVVNRQERLCFKHELYRIAIEESLSPYQRKNLHTTILKIMLESQRDSYDLSQLVHHARFADEKELIAKTAPKAAKEAATVGAHIEASKLYLTAIEYFDKQDSTLVELYEHHAYECYLTGQITSAIISQQHALEIWRERKVTLKIGDTLRFLSRLLWFHGSYEEAMMLALESIEVLENGFPTRERALAYSNIAQLYMLTDNAKKTLHWGQKAIYLAKKMYDQEILSHALNNVGTVLLKYRPSAVEGEEKLNQSLSIALKGGYHEHVARAYTNLSAMFVPSKRYEKASVVFDAGLKYCEAFDLNSWTYYMLGEKARYLLETGAWHEAEEIVIPLYNNSFHPAIIRVAAIIVIVRLKIRRGEFEEARTLITEGKKLAIPIGDAHRIIPLLTSELELCWITNDPLPIHDLTLAENTLFPEKNDSWYYSEFAYWICKCQIPFAENTNVRFTEPFELERDGNWKAAAEWWREHGCSYEQALALFMCDEGSQKQALLILDELGASATYEMLKSKLKLIGVKNIPRGPRDSTRSNPAQLTNRQMDVLILLKEGMQNVEIGDKLFISPKTVDHHISAILSKLNVNTRTKAVSEGRKLGILKAN